MLPGQDGSDGTISLEIKGDVAILRMCRGQNRLNFDFFDKLHEALDEVERNPAIQVLVTTGGGKFYSNGLDLNFLVPRMSDPDFARAFTVKFSTLTLRLLTFPVVTVCAVNGHAFAGGAIMALAHDYTVMQTGRGWWCLNEVHIGRQFSKFLKEIFRMKIPAGASHTEATVLGRRFTAEEALQAGIVQGISDPSKIIETAIQKGKKMVPKNGYNREYMRKMKNNIFQSVTAVQFTHDDTVTPFQAKL